MSRRRRRMQQKRRRHRTLGSTRRRLAAGAGLTIGATLAAGGTAQADTFPVNTGGDAGDLICDATCTLRDAVYNANLTTPSDDVVFASGLSGAIGLTQGYLAIDNPIRVLGPGPGQITVDGMGSDRIFSIFTANGGEDVLIDGLTLTNGFTYGFNGGAIGIGGAAPGPDVTISNSVVSGSDATGSYGDGGAIAVYLGTLTVQSSTLTGNTAAGSGGAIFSYGTDLTIENSTIVDNHALNFGGGGVYSGDDSMTIRNSTIYDNTAVNYHGGGVEAFGTNATIESSTISANTASYGAGLSSNNNVYFTTMSLVDTIVADNIANVAYPDVRGSFDAAFSLIEGPDPVNETVPNSNITGQDPELGPLANNGGPTQTTALPATSPAVDKGSLSGTDQRGLPRPFDFPSIPNSAAVGANGADIGAFELQPAAAGAGAGGAGAGAGATPPKCKGKTATIFPRAGLARTFNGTNKRDVIVGTTKKDTIRAKGGNDLVCAKGGKDTVKGGGGKDKLYGQGGADKLVGGGGNDKLVGGGGADKLLGKGGNDTCVGGAGKDIERSC
ncbi:MAG: choice-of-anchor Q domain-containing protein [Actinomycetota bacterium]